MRPLHLFFALSAGLIAPVAANAADLKIAATLKPLQSIAQNIVGDETKVDLIINTGTSAHVSNMRPSQAQLIQNADVLIAVGETLESGFVKAIEARAKDKHTIWASELSGMNLFDMRESGAQDDHGDEHKDEHDHDDHKDEHKEVHKHEHDDHEDEHKEALKDEDEDDHAHHDHGEGKDMHIWLNPANGVLIARAVLNEVVELDPKNAAAYKANFEKFETKIAALETEITAQLKPVKKLAFVNYHDAFQYFEKRYDLNYAGALSLSPQKRPGPKTLSAIRKAINEKDVKCVFSEPNLAKSRMESLVEGTQANIGILDPAGFTIDAGPNHYFEMMRSMAKDFATCLKG